jgi:hypothetical protein
VSRRRLERPSGRYGIALIAAAGAALAALVLGGFATGGTNGNGKGLSKADRALVATAKVNGKATVPLLMLAPGESSSVAGALTGLGASVVKSDASIGYIQANVPTDEADAAALISGVKAVTVDRAIPLVVPTPEKQPLTLPAVDPSTLGAINDYMPTGAIGAPQFVASHPTYDGRGVKVGIADTGVDLDRPELQTALDAAGHTVPKIYDWTTWTDPTRTGATGDPTWVSMTPVAVNSNGQNVTTAAGNYQLPAALRNTTDALVFGLFTEGDFRLGGELGSDVNRDGDTKDTFGVLEDTVSKTVWVDANGNGNYLDDMPMKDYAVNQDVNHFGKDNVGTKDVVETVPFVVQTTPDAKLVNIGIVSGGHGTHVAGTVAGKGFFGGRFDGVAPNAQLAVARVCLFITGCFTSDQINAFLYLIRTDHVDIIQMSIGGLPALNDDANDFESQVVDAITQVFGTQFFFSNGNDGPGANTAGSPATANAAIGTGAYQSKGTWAANYGANVSKDDTMWTFSSRGPREDGGLKPNVVAPGSELSTWPAWNLSEAPAPVGVGARVYQLPPGYEMIQGTSMASPMSAGEAALLISAARQNNLEPTAAQLRKAIQSGTRQIPEYQAYEQGNGLINVGAAWDVLKTNPSTPAISSTAEINTVLANGIAGYHGYGLYLREGWKPGDVGDRTIAFSGPDGTYNVTWAMSDGTFTSPSTVTIAGGTGSLPVHIGPVAAGIHSAILQLDDPSSAGIEYAVLNTVIASEQFATTGPDAFKIAESASPARADKKSFFIHVAAGTGALKLDETVTSGRTKLDIVDPFGDPYVLTAPCGCANDFATAPTTRTTTIANPMPGVWEVDIEASRAATVDPSTASFTATSLGVAISPDVWVVDPATIGTTYSQTFTFTNSMAAFNGLAVGTALASAHRETPTANDDHNPATADSEQDFTIDVPAGAPSLHVEIGHPLDPQADLDLFVFDPDGNLVGVSAGPTPNEHVDIANPVAGQYKATVDDFSVPSGSTTYRYLDLLPLPGLGSVTVTDTAADHATGTSWTAPATVTPTAGPGAGRILEGYVQVLAGSAVIGQANVDLTPAP